MVSDSIYIILLVIITFGWLLGCFICPPSAVRVKDLHAEPEVEKNGKRVAALVIQMIIDCWAVNMLPLFFCANVF